MENHKKDKIVLPDNLDIKKVLEEAREKATITRKQQKDDYIKTTIKKATDNGFTIEDIEPNCNKEDELSNENE